MSMSMEKRPEEASTGQESARVEAAPTEAFNTPPPAAVARGEEGGGVVSVPHSAALRRSSPRGKRQRLKKDSDGFSEHYLAQYGLSVAQGPETSLTSIRVLECRFCRVFGREAAPGRIRAVSRKVHQWKGPFKTHNFTIHLTVCHAEKWQLYKSIESEEAKEAFFGVDHSQLLAIANAAAAAAESRDRDLTEDSSGLLLLSNNGLPALNSNTKDAHQSAKRLKYLSAATAAVASQAGTSAPLDHEKAAAYPVRTIRFQRGTRTLDMMHEVRNTPNETMQTLVRRAKQDDLMNVFDATRNHGKNRGRNLPPKHLFFSIDGVGSFSEAVFLKTPIHGIFSLSSENPLVVELEYRVMEETSSEDDDGGDEEEEEGVDNDYEEQLAAAAAAVGNIRQATISPQQQLQQLQQQQQQQQPQQPQFLLQQPLPQQQPRYSAYPHQYTRTGFWMH